MTRWEFDCRNRPSFWLLVRGNRDRQSADQGPLRVWALQTQLEAHHKVDPSLGVGRNSVGHLLKHLAFQPKAAKNARDFPKLDLTEPLNLLIFLALLGGIVFFVRARGEIPAKSHSDRARGDLRESGRYNDMS